MRTSRTSNELTPATVGDPDHSGTEFIREAGDALYQNEKGCDQLVQLQRATSVRERFEVFGQIGIIELRIRRAHERFEIGDQKHQRRQQQNHDAQ